MEQQLLPQLFLCKEFPNTWEFIYNTHYNKPERAFWTSTYLNNTLGSDWVQWRYAEQFGNLAIDEWWVLTPKKNIRVYEINTLDDLIQLFNEYTYHISKERPYPYTNIITVLDYKRIANDYDGIHLTDHGQCETRFSLPGLYGWDCESVCWFNENWFESKKQIENPYAKRGENDH